MQEDYAESYTVAKNEDVIINTINGFYIPAGLPWHMIDEVYVPVNCGKKFYWILAVIVLKERVILDLLSSKKQSEPSNKIQKLVVILPTYLLDSGFFIKDRANWSTLKAYKGKLGQKTSLISQNPFDVEYVQNIPQQASNSLVTKAQEDYTSDNDDPPQPRNSYLHSTDESAIVTLE
ncbi:hypothetical protein CQW23_26484 [Capsicum baccatum]|uniref:Ubiquitin-like protease family profile domain-containing protein n=1 Tax=Capsicum baccatum TaxID=33114 RepID=A0A2G2VNY1_CAPBA|nr:hypothetical protein CQW23_26484 [Capsicum baccatum]